jgi:hypothetical protein
VIVARRPGNDCRPSNLAAHDPSSCSSQGRNRTTDYKHGTGSRAPFDGCDRYSLMRENPEDIAIAMRAQMKTTTTFPLSLPESRHSIGLCARR